MLLLFYLHVVDVSGGVYVVLIMSMLRVAPIKPMIIPRHELCGAYLTASPIGHVRDALHIPLTNVYAWMDSTIIISWLIGNPCCFKMYVANCVSHIIDFVPSERWNHISDGENPADCALRGMLPSELHAHDLWWNGPSWLHLQTSAWLKQKITG